MNLKPYLLHPPEKLDEICRLIPYSFIEEIVEEEFLEEKGIQLPDDLPLILEKAGHGIHLMDIVIDDHAYKILVRRGRIANISLIHRGKEYTGLEALKKLEEEHGPAKTRIYRIHPPTAKAIQQLLSGYEPMDKIHEEMISLANHLIITTITGELEEAARTAEKLYKHTIDKHFPYEENLMKKTNYPNIDEHLRYHEMYREALEQVRQLAKKKKYTEMIYELLTTFDSYLKYMGDEDKRLAKYIMAIENQKSI